MRHIGEFVRFTICWSGCIPRYFLLGISGFARIAVHRDGWITRYFVLRISGDWSLSQYCGVTVSPDILYQQYRGYSHVSSILFSLESLDISRTENRSIRATPFVLQYRPTVSCPLLCYLDESTTDISYSVLGARSLSTSTSPPFHPK